MPTLRAAIFDLDGTLLDTLGDLADAANEALARAGHPEHPEEAYRTFVGDGMHTLIARILPDAAAADAAEHARVLAFYREAYGRRWRNRTRPYPGMEDALRTLAAAGVPMAVLSNKPQSFTELCVAHHLAGHRFAPVFGQRDDVPRKPHPAGAHETAVLLGLPAEAIAFIGDTRTDMETATAAGMHPVGVTWGFRPAAELTAHGARVLVDHPGELAGLFA